MILKEKAYKENVAILKRFGDKMYKLTVLKSICNPNVENTDRKRAEKGTVNDSKIENNIQRARSKIFELAYCNPWEYFVTFTIDKTKYDRYDLNKYHDALSNWIQYYNRKHETKIKYLFIPEQHKDGAWHEHGFIMGLPIEHLRLFTLDEKLPDYIRDKLLKGEKVYDWTPYREKFGFVNFEPIKNAEAASKYVTKYINKDLSKSITEVNAHMYYPSKGLKRAEEIKRGTMFGDIEPQWDFENEYVKIMWIKNDKLQNEYSQNITSDANFNKIDANKQLKPLRYKWKDKVPQEEI